MTALLKGANQQAGSIAPFSNPVGLSAVSFIKSLKQDFIKGCRYYPSRNNVFINQGYLEHTFLNLNSIY